MASQNKGGTKLRRSGTPRTKAKYLRAFASCVARTGRWRGHPATLAQAGSGTVVAKPKWRSQ